MDEVDHMARARAFARKAWECRNEHCTLTFEQYWEAFQRGDKPNLFPKPVVH